MNSNNWPSTSEHREYLIQNIEVVDIETSTACNRRCTYCPNVNHDNWLLVHNTFMWEDTFSKIVKDLWEEWYSWEICLQRYNEPLMDKRLPKLISIAAELCPLAIVTVYSNGDYLNVDLYKELLSSWLKKLTITQHWEKASKWLLEVLEYREDNPDDIVFKYREMDANAKFYNRWWEIPLLPNQPQNFFCKALNCITIDANWDFLLCCNDYHSKHKFWNVKDGNVLDIFLSDSFQWVRLEAVTWRFSREICNLCMYWNKWN